jgi:hypothetical protein
LQKHRQYKRFLQYWQTGTLVVAAILASTRERAVVPPTDAHRALSQCCVNTSLSGTLFF